MSQAHANYLHSSNYDNRLNSNLSPFTTANLQTYKNQTNKVYTTLPITCHICLGKVKEPCVCPNLHAFCSFCIETWLEKSKHCPTCRISINKENPCRRILGSIENFDEVDLLKPTDFSHSSIRKARFLNIFEQYEEEINRLNKHIDSLNVDITKLKDANNQSPSVHLSSSPSKDLIQTLRTKLQYAQTSLEDAIRDRDRLLDSNKKLESENSILMQDLVRLKATLNEKNMLITSKYTVAALETKLENYEKEVKQLQKALQTNDKYIAELELKQREKEHAGTNTATNRNMNFFKANTSPTNNTLTSNSASNIGLANTNLSESPTNSHHNNNHHHSHSQNLSAKYAKNDNHVYKNESKIVKFAEKVDHIPVTASSLLSPPSTISTTNFTKQVVISNDKFYGSPSKIQPPVTPPPSSHTSSNSNVSGLMSFSDRLKKNSTNVATSSKYDLEAPSPLSQSLNGNSFGVGCIETQSLINYDSISHNNNNPSINNTRCNSTTSNVNSNQPSSSTHSFLFSPMKRLRLEEVTFEKPSFNAEDTLNNTTNLNETTQENSFAFYNNNKNRTSPSNQITNVRHISISPSRSSQKSGFTISKSSVNSHVVTPFNNRMKTNKYTNSNESSSDSGNKASEESDELNDEFNEKSKKSLHSENNNSSPEFIDCIELLNKAEKKVQNRFSPNLSNNIRSSLNGNGHSTSLKNNSDVIMTRTQMTPTISNNYDLPDKYFRATDHIESSPLTINNVLNYNNSVLNSSKNNNNNSNSSSENGHNGSKAVMISSSSFTLSSNSSNMGNSLSATIPTGASSLVSSASSSSSFHSNSNANFMPHNGFTSIEQNSNGNLRKFSSFDQNINTNEYNNQMNEFNSTLTNKEAQLQLQAENSDSMNRSKSVDPILRNSKP